ncbi:DUF2786 domain-containing protein [Actinoplanes sp. NPDC051851]|uniref:DUF2786 domain-containing protein n=1 Tax=Actinoplanes sp. NPDC051851 TaxID=3154753 RepID=UPI00343C4DA0
MGKNSRERHKAKRKAEGAARRRRSGEPGDPFGLFGAPRVPDQHQVVEALIDEAIHALGQDAGSTVDRCVDRLAAGPGGAAGLQVVNRRLFTGLLWEVDQAWRRGWQPSEIARTVRREHTARHGALVADAMAARMREYPAASVDARWLAQLDALGARVWWRHDDHFVDEWAKRHGADRGVAVRTAIEVLYLLLTLHQVAPVLPMPGTGRPAPATAGDLDQRLLDRVRALLAKAESTDFPEEAEAYTAKAQVLMTRHRIDHALLAAAGEGDRDRPGTRRVAVDNPYEIPKSLLLQVVAEANSCHTVWMKRFGLVAVVGFAADLDATELLFTSLLVQATRTMTGAGSHTDRHGRNTTRSFRQSFLTSYAHRIGERLAAVSEEAEQAAASTAGPALLPVLAARSDAVRDAVTEQFPDLRQVSATVNNREGWASGRAAADHAVLHGRDQLTPDQG